ncbi:MAG TPA: epoxyqueuosine reductase QueH [Candidatus Dojkabacteria bacterium]|nr:epoxyqueuosine reductase QueH [Candidatus Dojkabacteria bacterium]HQF36987.1 epoxyqueuosine reductase QueH [Candidatus Dojkabacteria bacterium]
MKLLIHVCCADCLLKIVDSLRANSVFPKLTLITFYFYNPNIHPRTEYLARLNTLKDVVKNITDFNYKLVIPDMSPKDYFQKIPLSFIPPPQEIRCPICWELRLRKSFYFASEQKFDFVTTTLLSSKYQDEKTIINLCKKLSKEFGVEFLIPDNINKDLCNHGFYKQNYCGCCFSLLERSIGNYKKSKL